MPFLELTLPCSDATQPRYQNALDDIGALAVTLLDANADTSNERAILEPGVGETPMWNTIVLNALFDGDSDALVLLAALEAFDPGWTGARSDSARSKTPIGNAPGWISSSRCSSARAPSSCRGITTCPRPHKRPTLR